jgi:hypothetical protein
LEARLRAEREKVVVIEESWRTFSWDEVGWDGEYAGELLGFLSNPGLLAGMIRDPRKIAEILRRAKMMAEIRERLRQEAKKMEYICQAIEEMVRAAKEAEERRWARQNQEWIHDKLVYNPADSICSTHEASFTPSSTMSLEESRRLAAERKISRSQLAPVTLQVDCFYFLPQKSGLKRKCSKKIKFSQFIKFHEKVLFVSILCKVFCKMKGKKCFCI